MLDQSLLYSIIIVIMYSKVSLDRAVSRKKDGGGGEAAAGEVVSFVDCLVVNFEQFEGYLFSLS